MRLGSTCASPKKNVASYIQTNNEIFFLSKLFFSIWNSCLRLNLVWINLFFFCLKWLATLLTIFNFVTLIILRYFSGFDRRPHLRRSPSGVPHQEPAPDPAEHQVPLLLPEQGRSPGLGGRADLQEVGGVGLGQTHGQQGSPPGTQRLRPLQADEGQVRPEQDRHQGRQHQEEEAVQGRETLNRARHLLNTASSFRENKRNFEKMY